MTDTAFFSITSAWNPLFSLMFREGPIPSLVSLVGWCLACLQWWPRHLLGPSAWVMEPPTEVPPEWEGGESTPSCPHLLVTGLQCNEDPWDRAIDFLLLPLGSSTLLSLGVKMTGTAGTQTWLWDGDEGIASLPWPGLHLSKTSFNTHSSLEWDIFIYLSLQSLKARIFNFFTALSSGT